MEVKPPLSQQPLWTTARFPSAGMRNEFLEQIALWNRIEDLHEIQVRADGDPRELDFLCADYRRIGLRKLAESYGGSIVVDPDNVVPFTPREVSVAFDLY